MAELKTKETKKSAARFIASIKDKAKREDATRLLKLMRSATGKLPRMWGETGMGPRRKGAGPAGPSRGRAKSQQRFMRGPSIVGFGKYHYKSERSAQEGDWPMIGFSPRAQNLTVYIMPGFKKYAGLLKRLGPHKKSVGCLYLKRLSDVDEIVLKTLIKSAYQEMRRRYA